MHERTTFDEVDMAEEVKQGQSVLLIWSGSTPPKKIEEIVVQLNSSVGLEGKVSVEHEERLKLCEYCSKTGWRQNVVRLKYRPTRLRWVSHWCSYRFWCFFASITGQTTAKWNLVVLQFGEQKVADCISQPFLKYSFFLFNLRFEQSVAVFSLKKSR